MARHDITTTHTAYIANLSLPGKKADELSYSFSEQALPANDQTAVFGLFYIQGAQEIYQMFIKETVKSYLDFFHRTRHELSNSGDEKNVDIDGFLFEHSLQYVNEHVSNVLAEYQEQSSRAVGLETRKMHFIIGALIGQTLYLTVHGKFVRAFLLYPTQSSNPSLPYALMDIAEQESADDQGAGFFSSVITGAVSIPRSKLVICNSIFLDYVSMDQLKHALTNQQSNTIASYFTRHLSRASARSDFAALFIDPWYEANSTIAHEQLPREMRTSHSSIESMLERQRGTSTVLMPGHGKVIKTLLQSGLASIINLLHRLPKNATVPSILRAVRVPKVSFRPHNVHEIASQIHTIASQSIHAARKAFTASFRFTKCQILPFASTTRHRIAQFLKERVWDAFQALQPNSKALLIVSLLFLILFLQSLVAIQSKRYHENKIGEQIEVLKQADQKLNLAEASIIYENDDKTRALLNEAKEILDTIRSLPDIESQIDSLRSKYEVLLHKLSRTIEIPTAQVFADLTNQIPSVEALRFVGETNPLFLTNMDGVYRIDHKTGNAQQINTQSKLPTIPCATASTPELIYICSAENKLFSYRLASDTLSAIPYAETGQTFGTIAIFNKRLYVLDPSRGILTRHNRIGDGFTGGTSWIKDGSTVVGAKDFAIDGNVYFLMPDSSLAVYNAGDRIKSIPLPSLQPPVLSISRIKASEDSHLLYAVDPSARRILLIDSRTSSFVLAVTSPMFEHTIQDILVTKSDLYVLTGGKLARIPLEQIKL